jgi:IS30 family transposase
MNRIRKSRRQAAARSLELWKRWKAGQSTHEIAAALACAPGTVHWSVRYYGGIEPAQRMRAAGQLRPKEREEISRGLAAGQSLREIARRLQRSPSTISREVDRNGGRCAYRAEVAERAAWRRAERLKPCLLQTNHVLRQLVSDKLQLDWSPQQIARWLRAQPDNGAAMYVCHETIYRSLFVQAKATLKQELTEHLRSRRRARRTHKRVDNKRGQIVGAVSISQRPAEAADRAVPGHWEGDLVVGAKNSYVATLVERRSRYVMLAKLGGKDSTTVVDALIKLVNRLPDNMIKTLTWDRGTELAQHARFTVASDVQVYFCDPRSPWQRGTNENTNGLLRQYLKKTQDLSLYTQGQLDGFALRLNTRPRMTLNWQTPVQVLDQAIDTSVALTG